MCGCFLFFFYIITYSLLITSQEAAALAELEDRMKSSNKLLTLKEQAVTDLQASIDSQVCTYSNTF